MDIYYMYITCATIEEREEKVDTAKKKQISAQAKASIKYMATHTKQVKFNFNYEYDADILAKLDSVPNKAGYIKNLIREDIAKQKGETK